MKTGLLIVIAFLFLTGFLSAQDNMTAVPLAALSGVAGTSVSSTLAVRRVWSGDLTERLPEKPRRFGFPG